MRSFSLSPSFTCNGKQLCPLGGENCFGCLSSWSRVSHAPLRSCGLCMKSSAYTFQPGKILFILQATLDYFAFPPSCPLPSASHDLLTGCGCFGAPAECPLGPCCPCHSGELQQWWCGAREVVCRALQCSLPASGSTHRVDPFFTLSYNRFCTFLLLFWIIGSFRRVSIFCSLELFLAPCAECGG